MTVSRNTPPNLPWVEHYPNPLMSRLDTIETMIRRLKFNNEPEYQRIRDYIKTSGRINLDRYALYQGGDNGSPGLKFPNSWSQAKKDWHAVQKIIRLGYKLGIRLRSANSYVVFRFMKVFLEIYLGPSFFNALQNMFSQNPILTHASSLMLHHNRRSIDTLPNPRNIYIPGFADNIFERSNTYSILETNIKRYLRRALGTTFRISERDINWALYTFYGSEAFRDASWLSFIRGHHSVGSNSNSNSGSNSNSRHSNSGAYKANTTRVKKNQNRNKNNKRIQWSKVTLKNAPKNEITFSNFSNGDKAVKLSWRSNSKTHSQYVSPQTFRNFARMSMSEAFNKAGNFTLFKNPWTRGMTKRSNIDFVILDLPRTRAATKIQKVVRGSQVRTKIRRNAERATRLASLVQRSAGKKRKRS